MPECVACATTSYQFSLNHCRRAGQRRAPLAVGRDLEVPPLVLRMRRRSSARPTAAEKAAPGRRLRQALDPQRPAEPHLLPEDPRASPSSPGICARPAGQHDRAGSAGSRSPTASSRARTSSRISSTRGRMMPISSVRLTICRRSCSQSPRIAASSIMLAVVDAGRHAARRAGLDPLGVRHRHLQPLADVGGDMVAAHAARSRRRSCACGMKIETPGRAAAHVDAGRAQLLLVLDEAGEAARHRPRRRSPREFEVAALDAVQQRLRSGVASTVTQVQVDREILADLPARIGEARCDGRARSSPAARAAPRGRGP